MTTGTTVRSESTSVSELLVFTPKVNGFDVHPRLMMDRPAFSVPA